MPTEIIDNQTGTNSHTPPDRSLQQRKDALERANDIRSYRANLKLDLKAGRVHVADLLNNPPEKIHTMKVFDLLIATPKLGRVKVNKALNRCRISPSKTVGGLSPRQRDELLVVMWRW